VLRRALVILLAVTSALGLAVAARVAWIGYGPPLGDSITAAQVKSCKARSSPVTVRGCSRCGDTSLALDLSRQAELVGLPTSWGGERRYAFGALPVGDAFLAWARTRPGAEPLPADSDPAPGRPWWPAFGLPFLLPLVVLIAIARPGRRA
jgi:hypothetical protein